MVPRLFHREPEGITAYTLWMAMQWQVSLMLVLKKKIVVCKLGTKDCDISARKVTSSQFLCRKTHYSRSWGQSHVESVGGKLEPRVVKWLFLGNPKGVKGYMLYSLDNESPNVVTSRNVVFNESVMYKDTLRDSGAMTDKSVEELHVEAVACGDSSKWKSAMEEEMDSPRKNKTWELVDHPVGKKLVNCKWLFKIKEVIKGVQNPKYKVRLVAHGFTERACIYYNELFLSAVQHTSFRVIISLTALRDYELKQLDVKTTFLHWNLEKVIYIRHASGYEQGNKVCLLKKHPN
ncbi:retrotransposon protein, putative, ty1-copia subclass [Tanacetum coccineum]